MGVRATYRYDCLRKCDVTKHNNPIGSHLVLTPWTPFWTCNTSRLIPEYANIVVR